MGRGRGKGKKLTGATSHGDVVSGGEEPLPSYKRRGRPQKPLKDDIVEEEIEKIEEDEGDLKLAAPTKESMEVALPIENGKRRRQHAAVKENSDSNLEENGTGLSSTTTEESTRKNGFQQYGSRRKSKPHQAADAGVVFK